MLIDFVVMGHEKRAEYFDYLRNHLGPNILFSIDDDRQQLGTWGNCRRAWSMIKPEADYGFVIQDDAILRKDFVRSVYQFVQDHPNNAYQLFYGARKQAREIWEQSTTKHAGYICWPVLMWGVAIGLPQQHIHPMVEYGDLQDDRLPDDTRIKNYLLKENMHVYYPNPSFVDHRPIPSLVDHNKPLRQAHNYVG